MIRRIAIGCIVGALIVLGLIDGIPVVEEHLASGQNALDCASQAAQAIRGAPIDTTSAVVAYDVAQRYCDQNYHAQVLQRGFKYNNDGTITLTYTRSVHTIVFHRLPWLKEKTAVTVTVTHGPYF